MLHFVLLRVSALFVFFFVFFFSSRTRHTRLVSDWSSDVCSSDLPWRDLLRVYRRLDARGEIRGGRFVGGFSGEHFASTEAVQLLRSIRRAPAEGMLISLSAADPLDRKSVE